MTVARITTACLEDVEILAPQLRRGDVEEIYAQSLRGPRDGLLLSLKVSTHAWSGWAGNELVCMFGCGPRNLAFGIGSPWLLASPALEDHAVAFLRRNRKILNEITATYCRLENWVDVRNTTAIRWLEWLGFTILDPVPYGPLGLPFHPFVLEV